MINCKQIISGEAETPLAGWTFADSIVTGRIHEKNRVGTQRMGWRRNARMPLTRKPPLSP